ncbi:MAG: hypothetical protein ACM34N_09680 [Ignavibacteria bacterium]
MKTRFILSFFLSLFLNKIVNTHSPVELKAIFEAAGQDSCALPGNYVKT